jgi:type II secretory ATPase GspE/PulE/Tfp pilus assembly ATPase PilB-like protein
MKINFISKLINYGLWQGASSLYFELSPNGLEVDYHSTENDDLLLPKSACDKFITELNFLSNNQKLESGATIYFKIETAINTRSVSLTSIAGENHKYLVQVIEPESTAWKLSSLGMDSDILRNIKKHLETSNPKGLIALSSKDRNDREKSLEALAYELKKLNREIISLGKINNDITYIDKDEKFLKNINGHDLISFLNKHSEDIIISNIEDDNIIEALIKYSLNSDKLIILPINGQSSNDTYNKLQEKNNDKGLSKKINFILHQQTFKRLCPFCLSKVKHNSYEAKDLDNFSFHYDLGDIKNNSYNSSGCKKCDYKAYNGDTLAFEALSFIYPHLNTPSIIDDASKKQSLGIISASDLLNLSRV